jgi:hypothetical protein
VIGPRAARSQPVGGLLLAVLLQQLQERGRALESELAFPLALPEDDAAPDTVRASRRRRKRRRWPGVSTGLWPWGGLGRCTPGHSRRDADQGGLSVKLRRVTARCRLPRLPIVQLAATASMAALEAVACEPWTRQPLTWIWRLRGRRGQSRR